MLHSNNRIAGVFGRPLRIGLLLTSLLAAIAGASPTPITTHVLVVDQSSQPVPGVVLQLKAAATKTTGEDGRAEFQLAPGHYLVTATKEGFETLTDQSLDISAAATTPM